MNRVALLSPIDDATLWVCSFAAWMSSRFCIASLSRSFRSGLCFGSRADGPGVCIACRAPQPHDSRQLFACDHGLLPRLG
jgi:hypothetical protein